MNSGRKPDRWLQIGGHVITAAYLIAAAVALVWGAKLRFALPQTPIIDPDIEGYLGPAISALGGNGFVHLIGRSFPYPVFVYAVLRLFGDFRAIAVIQHILGLGAGALILAAWNAAGRLIPAGGVPKPLYRALGLAPACIYLGSATAIFYEHQIRPEAVFSFLAILNLWIGFLFLEARFVRPHPRAFWLGALNIFIACLIYETKPSFGLAVVLTTLPVWISLLLPGMTLRKKGGLAAAAILPALLLLLLPEHVLKRNDPWSKIFLPETLLTVHASIIEQQMAEDLASSQPPPYPHDFLLAAHDFLKAELAKAAQITTPKAYETLGFNPDYLMYDYSFCVRFQKDMHLTPQEMGDFCMTYYKRALLHHPGAMARKTETQLALVYNSKCPIYWTGRNLSISDNHYARTAQIIPLTQKRGPNYTPLSRYIESCNQLAQAGLSIAQSKSLTAWLRWFAAGYLRAAIIALLSPLLLLWKPLRAHFGWLVAALWLAHSDNFGNSLTIAVVHSLEVNRYVRIQLIFTVFAQCLSFYLLLELAAFGIRAGLARIAPQWAGVLRPQKTID